MDSLVATGYGSDDPVSPKGPAIPMEAPARTSGVIVNVAPAVDVLAPETKTLSINTTYVEHNPTYESMYKEAEGPANPYKRTQTMVVGKSTCNSGYVEEIEGLEEYNFQEQYHTFQSYGYAVDPGSMAVVGDAAKANATQGGTVFAPGKQTKGGKRRWWKELEDTSEPGEMTKEQAEYIEVHKKTRTKRETDTKVVEEQSIFHGDEEKDYMGRSFVDKPSDCTGIDDEHQCYLPKKLAHTWTGHTKGVSAIRFFPKSGHLLLSASMDSKVKIWDTNNGRKCLRTYMGHTNAVRDVQFTNDGKKFISVSYDRYAKLWDTETGQCLGAFSNKKIPYCAKFHPDENKQHLFLTGCSDKKIIQWDINSGKLVQEYDAHLGGVNSITFADNNRRFITTSDDKKIYIWEWGIPVVMKHISEPHMHSVPCVVKHPSDKFFLGQSLDNTIVCYTAKDRFTLQRKKVFKGHLNAGYACQVDVSPDGRFVLSGDADGRAFIWDWKSCKPYKKLQAHDQVCIGAAWHPVEPSKIATCSWDGTIKYWD